MLRPRLTTRALRPGLLCRPARRSYHHHTLPILAIEKQIPGFQEKREVPGFLSEAGFHTAWYEYQYHILGRLTQAVAGTSLEGKDPKSIAMSTSRDPSKAHIFNYASMAHNNHFFFERITVPPKGESPKPCPDNFKRVLENNFSSMDTLRKEFIATANAMFGPGFVWLVKVKIPGSALGPDTLRILPTYLAGSPYPQAHWRRQSVDANTIGEAGGVEGQRQAQELIQNQQRTHELPTDRDAKRAPGGVTQLTPLLCVNTWEHVWVPDYGFGVYENHPGKKGYLEAWWDTINWEMVADAAHSKNQEMTS